jgi:hypothetical protein
METSLSNQFDLMLQMEHSTLVTGMINAAYFSHSLAILPI